MLGAMCAGTVLSSCTSTKVKAEEPTEKYKRLIFFFSATGNSLYIAKELSGAEGTLMSIPQEIHNEHPVYEAEEIGIVCPIYCFIPPTIVQEFFARSTFKADYLFCVGTYGANSTIFPEYVAQMAKDKGLEMNYINTIKMVDTYLPFYDMELQKAEDKQIPENLAAIKASVNSRENYIRPVSEQEKMFCEGYYRFSGRDRVKPTFTRSEKISFQQTIVLVVASVTLCVLMVLGKLLTERVWQKEIVRTAWHVYTIALLKLFPSYLHHQSQRSQTVNQGIVILM